MEIIEREIPLNKHLSDLFTKDTFFFDIETLGLSPKDSPVYLIGVMDKKDGPVKIRLFFANTREDEEELLRSFFQYTKDFSGLITFNGETFDVPFVRKRSENYGIPMDFNEFKRFDLYKELRRFKKIFGMERTTQKSFEEFLGLYREDKYDGGRLINVYYEYENSRDRYLKNLLILHNFEDVEGMAHLNGIRAYFDIESGKFTIDSIIPEKDRIRFIATLKNPVPRELDFTDENYEIHISKVGITGSLLLKETTLKFFHKNISDYVYIPTEGIIIPKSLAGTISGTKEKATRENCCTNVSGTFFKLPSRGKVNSCFNTKDKIIFRNNFLDKSQYLLIKEERKESPDFSELSGIIYSLMAYCFS